MVSRVLITTVPFGDNSKAVDYLEQTDFDYLVNPIGRKLLEEELYEMVGDYDAIIAGTEEISKRVIEKGNKLKLISRVGIGLDGVDLLAARSAGVQVSYTPDAPSPAAAELTLGLILSLARSIHVADSRMKDGEWERFFGRRLALSTVGVVGCGRIGSRVIKLLSGFEGVNLLVNDLERSKVPENLPHVSYASLEEIYSNSDIITFHVPLNKSTYGMVSKNELVQMKNDVALVNVSRGGIVNENDLYEFLLSNTAMSAAIDVFEVEPYVGTLTELPNCLLTSHMGSMTVDCRSKMEEEATKETIQFLTLGQQSNPVPDDEYSQRD